MPITEVRIHPAIGIARVGNCPTDFFIGPETAGDLPVPDGGYKDASCRIRRQAARFRLYGYDGGGNLVGEVTAAVADQIAWTVHVANRKAAAMTFSGNGLRNPTVTNAADRNKLVIDPGARTLSALNARAEFDTGTFTCPVNGTPQTLSVPLGEMRTDDVGRLLVLGGFGKSGSVDPSAGIQHFANNDTWYDDVSDGPVTATVVIGVQTFVAKGAWVIVAPTDFAPDIDTMQTLYDKILDLHWPPAVGVPSYTNDIYPILLRASRVAWTRASSAPAALDLATVHGASPATRNTIIGQIGTLPGGLSGVQQQILQKWATDNYNDDWTGVPPAAPAVNPDALDRASLEACVGNPFYPGIEAGAFVDTAANFSERLRIDHATVQPGQVTARMAVPWQADFFACSGDSWWPAQRPNSVLTLGAATEVSWTRGVSDMQDMVTKWSTLGFVIKQGADYLEVERCADVSIFLRTPVLTFYAEQGFGGLARTVSLPVVFEVTSPAGPVDLWISGPPSGQFAAVTSGTVTVPAGTTPIEVQLWLSYTTAAAITAGAPDTSTAVVSAALSGITRTYTVDVKGYTSARSTTAVALVLDRSGSMNQDRGDGESKIKSLRRAAKLFVDAMLEGDAVGIVRYNQDAQSVLDPVPLGDPTQPDANRDQAKTAIDSNQLDPAGATSIGDGIELARAKLNATAGYDEKALVVMTDGNENSSAFIADVADDIDEKVFALGLGRPENTSAAVLQTLSGNHGGYLLVTGDIDASKELLLEKYFVQILGGIANADVILDPDGNLHPGETHEIPFNVGDSEFGLEAYMLSRRPKELDFALRTPNGTIIDAKLAAALHPRAFYVSGEVMQLYRLALPVDLGNGKLVRDGRWSAMVKRKGQYSRRDAARDPGLRYSVVVHGHSDLKVSLFAHQKSFEPGGAISFSMTVNQYGIPLDTVSAWADVIGANGTSIRRLELNPQAGGTFAGRLNLDQPGLYPIRIQVRGRTLRGTPFEREQTRTLAVWAGGDRPPSRRRTGEEGVHADLCSFDSRLKEILCKALACNGKLDDALVQEISACGLDPKEVAAAVSRLGRTGRKSGEVSAVQTAVRKRWKWLLSRFDAPD